MRDKAILRAVVAAIATSTVAVGAAEAATATRGVTVALGYEVGAKQPLLLGNASCERDACFGWGNRVGPTSFVLQAYENDLGSTAADPRANAACASLTTETGSYYDKRTKTTVTTTGSDGGCGSLSVRGLGTGVVLASGRIGDLDVDLTVAGHLAGVMHPMTACPIPGGGSFPCWGGRAGVYRQARVSGTVSGPDTGTTQVGSLRGGSLIWELFHSRSSVIESE